MKKLILLLSSCIIYCSLSFGQGIIRGKLTDENGEPVVGANIVLKSKPTVWAMSDFNGQYSLKIESTTPETIVVYFISYQKIEEEVNPQKGEIIIKNFNMVPATVTIQEAVVTAKSNKSKDVYMEKMKSNSVLSLDFISSETLKKTGDVNVASAVARVAGVSTNGSFITVRGIGDRYMKTAINGSRIPTLDPFTNNIKLDLFPASLVDNIIITKTASPDLPGDWAGAYLSVETKDYPDKLSVNFETSWGYNQQSTFKDVISSQRSATDWLGYDNGLRDINHKDFVQIYLTPSTYQEFVALKPELANYYKTLGITPDNWNQNATTYTKLGYVQLGLLGVADFNNNAAYTTAQSRFQNDPNFLTKAKALINAPGVKSQAKLFPDNWLPITRKAPMNNSQSFSIGNQTNLFGKPLGFFVGFRYSSSIQYDPNYIGHPRYPQDGNSSIGSNYDTLVLRTSKETNGWSALINLAYKYHPNHSFTLLFMPNLIGVNNIRDGLDYNNITATSTSKPEIVPLNGQFYETRKQMVYQLKSEHYIPTVKLKMELSASYTNGNSNAPDFKIIQPGSAKLDRYFRYLSENLLDTRFFAEFPLGMPIESGTRKIKFGAAYQYNGRKFDQYDYIFQQVNSNPSRTVDSTLNSYYSKYNYPSDHIIGHSSIKAGFVMADFPLNSTIRFSGGLRIEQSNMFTDLTLFDSLKLAANDPRRSSIQAKFSTNNIPGSIDQTNLLPSFNLIFKLKHAENAPTNLRLSYSKTIARPALREISDAIMYDYEYQGNVQGNPNLKIVQINNYDVRFETYFETGDDISISLFYKDFKNHIEFIKQSFNPDMIDFVWLNSPYKCWLKGIEIEGKKNIFKELEFRANVTFVSSLSKMSILGQDYKHYDIEHTMYGQAPYIINGILTYNSEKLGLIATLSYNIQGPRLAIAGLPGTDFPDVYEMPRNLFDFKASKTIGKHLNASIKIMDLLNSSIRRAYKFPQGYILDYEKYTYGTNFVFALAYKL